MTKMVATAKNESINAGLFRLLSGVFLLIGLMYWIKGLYTLLFVPEGAADLMRRWHECRFFLNGVDPIKATPNDPATYPPWAFVFALLFVWPEPPFVRWYYAVWQIGLMAVLLFALWRILDRERVFVVTPPVRLFVLSSVLAIGAFCTNTGTGNYALFAVTLAALMFYGLGEASWRSVKGDVALGIVLALAMIKPTIAIPFAFSFVFLRRWRVIAFAAVVLILTSLVSWAIVKVDPVTLTMEMLREGKAHWNISESVTFYVGRVAPVQWVTIITAIIGLVPLLPLMVWANRRHLLTALALAGVSSRLWAYHRTYDDVLMLFPLVLFGVQGYGSQPSRLSRILFWVCGITLWIPASLLTKFEFLKPIFLVFWFACAFVVYFVSKKELDYNEANPAASEPAASRPASAPL